YGAVDPELRCERTTPGRLRRRAWLDRQVEKSRFANHRRWALVESPPVPHARPTPERSPYRTGRGLVYLTSTPTSGCDSTSTSAVATTGYLSRCSIRYQTRTGHRVRKPVPQPRVLYPCKAVDR